MNDRLLKRLILKEIHSVLNEGEVDQDKARKALDDLSFAVTDLSKVFFDDKSSSKIERLRNVVEKFVHDMEVMYNIEYDTDYGEEPLSKSGGERSGRDDDYGDF